MYKNKKGFTLVELLVVVAIIGLLSTLAVVALGSARQKARDAKRLSDIKQVQTALELYFSDNSSYPVVSADTVLGGASTKTLSSTGFSATATAPTYMGLVPANPTPGGADYIYRSKASDGTTNCTAAPCPAYTITLTIEGATGGLAAGAHTASPGGII